MFWVLCIALARANPKKTAPQEQKKNEAYDNFCQDMLLESKTSLLRKRRGVYLQTTEQEWRQILHPDLGEVASLFHHMGQYLGIRTFDAKRETWGDYHAHNMFKVLLFSAIQKFRSNPVPLCTHAPRYASKLLETRSGKHIDATTQSRMSGKASSHQSHNYNTRPKDSFSNAIPRGSKRPREDDEEESGESHNDRSDDGDYVPAKGRAKKLKLEKVMSSTDPLKEANENDQTKEEELEDSAGDESVESLTNRERWYFLDGINGCCRCGPATPQIQDTVA
jgi:hypothetical protein